MIFEIEYCEKWNYHPEFDRVSKIILEIYPNANIYGNIKPPRSGSFEVTLNKKIVFSKFKTGNFPNSKDIKSWSPKDIWNYFFELMPHIT